MVVSTSTLHEAWDELLGVHSLCALWQSDVGVLRRDRATRHQRRDATTLGGVAIGEITNRVSALVLDDRAHGFSRFLRELTGTLFNPIQGFNRIVSGKAWKVRRDYYKYHDYLALPVAFSVATGDRYLADEAASSAASTIPMWTLDWLMETPSTANKLAPTTISQPTSLSVSAQTNRSSLVSIC